GKHGNQDVSVSPKLEQHFTQPHPQRATLGLHTQQHRIDYLFVPQRSTGHLLCAGLCTGCKQTFSWCVFSPLLCHHLGMTRCMREMPDLGSDSVLFFTLCILGHAS
ncbi:mCG145203, partial [Mus musculus]